MTWLKKWKLSSTQTLVLAALAFGSLSAQAQSKIHCLYNADAARYEAPLAWQNTLGAARANAMCSRVTGAVIPATPMIAASPVIAAAPVAPMAPAAAPPPERISAPAQPVYSISSGEKVSEVLTKWAAAQGYSLVWDAPGQSDLSLLTGTVEAQSLTEAVGKLVTALNSKLAGKRSANNQETQFAFPVEAIAYSNNVIAVTVKQ